MAEQNNKAVVLNKVSKSFGEKEVLKEIQLQVQTGEIFGLLGPSGAGKTTMIKLITGQLMPSQGEICLFGKKIKELSGRRSQGMGMMLDNLGLYERLSCYDNLKLFAGIYGVEQKRIRQVLETVGLWEARRQAVCRLSKGMRGRLAFARAILGEAQLLFLDEPTSGLDPATAAKIHSLILSQKEKGTTVFLTTHNMTEAQKLCDHVALLDRGKIVEYGNPGELCRKYDHQRKLVIRLQSGEEAELPNRAASAKQLLGYMQQGIASIHSTEPDMESVFMELTGGGLKQ